MPYHSTSHIAQSIGSANHAISLGCDFLAKSRVGTECRFHAIQKILQNRPYGSVQTDGVMLAHIVHDGSSRNCVAALRDRHAEPRKTDAYLKQYVEELSGEPACRQVYRSSGSLIAAEALMNYAG